MARRFRRTKAIKLIADVGTRRCPEANESLIAFISRSNLQTFNSLFQSGTYSGRANVLGPTTELIQSFRRRKPTVRGPPQTRAPRVRRLTTRTAETA